LVSIFLLAECLKQLPVDTELTGFLALYLRMNKILSLNNLQKNDT
jgi:hypothetical protein